MANSNILEEIGKKSQEIMRSNEELAARLRKNQDTLAHFSLELEGLRGVSGEAFESSLRKELEKLKIDLEGKKTLITTLIDDIKPIELDMVQREELVNSLKKDSQEQNKRIDSLSNDLQVNKKNFQQMDILNTELKTQLSEKDILLKVMKDKLTEKMLQIKDLETRNNAFADELAVARKEIFALNNRTGTIEKRVYSTDEQNQKLLYELAKQKERLAYLEAEISEKNALLTSHNAVYAKDIEALQFDAEERTAFLIKDHAKRIASMNAAIVLLKSKLDEQNRIVEEKTRRERALIGDFNSRMQEIIAANPTFSSDVHIPDIPPVEEEPKPQPMFKLEFESTLKLPSKMDEIVPMIEIALDHGDDTDMIRHSLVSSGYSRPDIDEAFSVLKLK